MTKRESNPTQMVKKQGSKLICQERRTYIDLETIILKVIIHTVLKELKPDFKLMTDYQYLTIYFPISYSP